MAKQKTVKIVNSAPRPNSADDPSLLQLPDIFGFILFFLVLFALWGGANFLFDVGKKATAQASESFGLPQVELSDVGSLEVPALNDMGEAIKPKGKKPPIDWLDKDKTFSSFFRSEIHTVRNQLGDAVKELTKEQ